MTPPPENQLLLTSFDVWEPQHRSNSSDDLLLELINRKGLLDGVHLLRKLPVDFQLAPELVISAIAQLNPRLVICCGMAEKRQVLTVEANAKRAEQVIETAIDVHRLVENLPVTEVSHDAGGFVCNHLYFSVLRHIRENQLKSRSIFVHVPVLNPVNLLPILEDFSLILQALAAIEDG